MGSDRYEPVENTYLSAVSKLDPENNTLSGGKFKNPNVGSYPNRKWAFVAWGAGTVAVMGAGLASAYKEIET